ncbi:hypothetical protein [Corynebacterium glucuronolyticum]|uniref:hypothetical protein n=1 Tax=Corynebacterium glucuronolyticum TaxID=39791 RepID=UPI00223BC649|nr:hypothetical protein [Corynebacterium glucuronolyticum]MCT1442947.1 hypothetical protein [Corynebacterium glucuronolyticum]
MYNEVEYVAEFAQKAREILTKAGVESAQVTTTLNPAGGVHTGVGLTVNSGEADVDDLMREIQTIKDGDPEVEATVNIAVDVRPDGWSADVFEFNNTSALGLFDSITRPKEFHFEPQPPPGAERRGTRAPEGAVGKQRAEVRAEPGRNRRGVGQSRKGARHADYGAASGAVESGQRRGTFLG